MTAHERDLLGEAFEMGRQAGESRGALLEARERAVEKAGARLREKAIVLGVAEWALSRDSRNRATVCVFRIYDEDMRDSSIESLIEAGKANRRMGMRVTAR